jgi:hypothetical protein
MTVPFNRQLELLDRVSIEAPPLTPSFSRSCYDTTASQTPKQDKRPNDDSTEPRARHPSDEKISPCAFEAGPRRIIDKRERKQDLQLESGSHRRSSGEALTASC